MSTKKIVIIALASCFGLIGVDWWFQTGHYVAPNKHAHQEIIQEYQQEAIENELDQSDDVYAGGDILDDYYALEAEEMIAAQRKAKERKDLAADE